MSGRRVTLRVTLTQGANVTSQRVPRSPGEDGGEEDQGPIFPSTQQYRTTTATNDRQRKRDRTRDNPLRSGTLQRISTPSAYRRRRRFLPPESADSTVSET